MIYVHDVYGVILYAKIQTILEQKGNLLKVKIEGYFFFDIGLYSGTISKKGVIDVVIQLNMSTNAIIQVWENTVATFEKYNIPISEKTLEELVNESVLPALLSELNSAVGSSSATCTVGG